MYKSYNPNPQHKRVGDCTVRAVAKVLGQSWEEAYVGMCLQGYLMSDLPSSNDIWGEYLKSKGFCRYKIPNEDRFYTIRDFCAENRSGTFALGTGTHAVAAVDGDYYDTWDSGDEIVLYVWVKKERT